VARVSYDNHKNVIGRWLLQEEQTFTSKKFVSVLNSILGLACLYYVNFFSKLSEFSPQILAYYGNQNIQSWIAWMLVCHC